MQQVRHSSSSPLRHDQLRNFAEMLEPSQAPVPYRATGDLDPLSFDENAPEAPAAVFADILATPPEDDGLVLKPKPMRVAAAREQDQYAGTRLNFMAEVAGAHLPIHVDIGYGDVATPDIEIDYPSLPGQSAPRLRAYPPETVLAEKFQAMGALGMLNSRMTEFAPARQNQRAAFLRRAEIAPAPETFPECQSRIAQLVLVPAAAIARAGSIEARWARGGPWMPG